MNLRDKKIVITGANGGLGKAVVEACETLGADLVLLDLAFAEQGSVSSASSSSSDSTQIALDLCDLAACQQCFADIGPFDALFNLAGGFGMGLPVHSDDDSQWDFLFKINVTTLRNACKAAVPIMLDQGYGKIVNVGALGAVQGGAMMSAYSASKSVVMRLTESMSGELREQGINVNAVLPSVIDTPQNREGMPEVDPALWVAPSDLANVICFLGSDAATAVHGALVPVRGLS